MPRQESRLRRPPRRILAIALLGAALSLPSLAQARSTTRSAHKARPSRSARKARVAGKVNLNTATARQLVLLPRVGKRTARAILAYRARRRFQTIREIIRVKGIGKRSFLRLKPHLTVRGPTTLRKLPAPKRRKARRRTTRRYRRSLQARRRHSRRTRMAGHRGRGRGLRSARNHASAQLR